MSENDLKSFVKFVIHRNKIYSFLNSLNLNEMNVSFENLLTYLETKKYNIFKFTKFLKTYSVDITVREFNMIFLIIQWRCCAQPATVLQTLPECFQTPPERISQSCRGIPIGATLAVKKIKIIDMFLYIINCLLGAYLINCQNHDFH